MQQKPDVQKDSQVEHIQWIWKNQWINNNNFYVSTLSNIYSLTDSHLEEQAAYEHDVSRLLPLLLHPKVLMWHGPYSMVHTVWSILYGAYDMSDAILTYRG